MRWLAFLLLLVTTSAVADVNKVNYLGTDPTTAWVNFYTTSGNYVENGEFGDLKQFGGVFYWYTMSADTGWVMGTPSPAQGLRVYSSPDLVNWTDRGTIIDVTQAPFNTECTGVLSSVSSGHSCYGPRMLFNATTGKYVLFYSFVDHATFSKEEVFECATPLPPCTYIGAMPSWPSGSENAGIYPDEQSADAFAVFEGPLTGTATLQKLTADYHDLTGSPADTGLGVESPWMKHVGGKWIVGNGDSCSDCPAGHSYYVSANTWNGTYSAPVLFAPIGTCNSQASEVTTITAGGITTYMFIGTRFVPRASQAQTSVYWQPLTLTGDLFDPFTCNGTVTIPGVTATGTYPTPSSAYTFDVDFMKDLPTKFYDYCAIGPIATIGANGFMQQFVPSVAPLYAVALNLGKGTDTGTTGGAVAGYPPDGSIDVAVTTDSGGVPGTVLAHTTYSVSSLPWVSQFTAVPMNLTLTPGTTYDVVVKGSSQTIGCVSLAQTRGPTNIYSPNVLKYTNDGGATWITNSTITTATMAVSTIPNPLPAPPVGGRHFGWDPKAYPPSRTQFSATLPSPRRHP